MPRGQKVTRRRRHLPEAAQHRPLAQVGSKCECDSALGSSQGDKLRLVTSPRERIQGKCPLPTEAATRLSSPSLEYSAEFSLARVLGSVTASKGLRVTDWGSREGGMGHQIYEQKLWRFWIELKPGMGCGKFIHSFPQVFIEHLLCVICCAVFPGYHGQQEEHRAWHIAALSKYLWNE